MSSCSECFSVAFLTTIFLFSHTFFCLLPFSHTHTHTTSSSSVILLSAPFRVNIRNKKSLILDLVFLI